MKTMKTMMMMMMMMKMMMNILCDNYSVGKGPRYTRRNDCKQIILFDGGFTGPINSVCNYTNDTFCYPNMTKAGEAPLTLAQQENLTCFSSFNTNTSNASIYDETCSVHDSGVCLVKNNSDGTVYIQISRTHTLAPKQLVCFMRGCQTYSQASELLNNCIQLHKQTGNSAHYGNVTCVDPETLCAKALYEPNCNEDSNHNMVNVTAATPECYKCGRSTRETDGHLHFSPNSISNSSYFNFMKDLNKEILHTMENKSSVSVSVDDIKGIFVKQQKEEVVKPLYFMFSSQNNFMMVEDNTQILSFNTTFTVPTEAFKRVSNVSQDVVFVSLFRFASFPQDEKNSTLLNNEVYSIDMGTQISNLTDTFNLTFNSLHTDDAGPLCSSWDGRGVTPKWTTDGCNTSYINSSVTCMCQHLTYFAVLMTASPTHISTSDLNSLTFLTSIGCSLSLFFLSIALFMHFLLRRGEASVTVHILINLFLALFLLDISFLVNESVANANNDVGCKLMAGTMHYFMLSTFTWFGLQALHLCLQLTLNVTSIHNYIIKLCIAGWVPPAVIVAAIFPSQKYNRIYIVSDTGKQVSMCWISDPLVHYTVNICYYSIIFLFTFLTFVVMLRLLYLIKRKLPAVNIPKRMSRPSDALTIMGLCSILGLSWGFAFFAYGRMQIPAYYIFSVLNSCQGVCLFVYYYHSSRVVGEAETLAEETSSSTVVENPYITPKSY